MKKLTKTVPPKRGPNPQGFKDGADIDIFGFGNDDFQALMADASYTKKSKNYDLTGGLKGSLTKSKGQKLQKNIDSLYLKGKRKFGNTTVSGGVEKELFGNKDTKFKVGLNYKFSKGGCPYREMGAKSDIQGVKDIQIKGKKFTGLK